ncbi:unnamed protein product [Diatraea saccharalis]|uniref:Deltamethrin resistance protein prag01 domain-containing protein n=1 Tax=Diatraea saccharalis TaxID=40085 RepID=A0A9N9WCP1_9NEOP|nr:unnamed protein product [Diatraea saccharalis]
MFASRQIVSRFMQQTARRYHAGEGFKPPTMDDLPVPRGSWQANYDARQRKYNAALILGIGFSIASVAVAKASGLLYLNFSPPKSLD